LISLANLISI